MIIDFKRGDSYFPYKISIKTLQNYIVLDETINDLYYYDQ